MPPRGAGPSAPPASVPSKRPQRVTANDDSSSSTRALKMTYDTLTARENRGMVKAVSLFGVGFYSLLPDPLAPDLKILPLQCSNRAQQTHPWSMLLGES